ncbi:MAG: 23S rRNA (uracil(1939)-C(5))-methyltransferase RlmD [Rhodothermaceae bacterium]|nr:23S rRNA (uracil(1939)-C(5))-methyltransferase RlmD [Rhodothermaceae bacterium]
METPNSAPPTRPRLKRGAEIELTLEKFADRGKSLARLDGYVVFVAGAVPGDRVRAKVFKRKKSFAEARLLEVLEPSDLRTEPRCEYFAACGGCKWQHVEYEAQLDMKQQAVAEALAHTGGLDLEALGVEVRPTLGAEDTSGIYFYRNKMEFSFAAQRWLTDWEIASGETLDKTFALGLHVPGRFDKVLDLKACYLQSEWSARLVNGVRAFAKEHGWEPWHARNHTGFLRHLVIRTPAHTDERMVVLVTNGYDAERMAAFSDWLRADFPEVTTLINTVNTGVAQTAYGEAMHTVFGSGVVHDRMGDYTFEIAPNAFFQTNTKQAERLYDVVVEFADFKPDDLVYDLYCGAGTISLTVANQVKRVVGVELIEEAVQNARANAEANGVDNCTFVAGDMLELFTPAFVEEHRHPDVLIIDPPRAGMHPKVVEQVAALRPERIVYVSCNPQTQAMDLKRLMDTTAAGYRIEAIQPVDLFPHTHHIENVIKLVPA